MKTKLTALAALMACVVCLCWAIRWREPGGLPIEVPIPRAPAPSPERIPVVLQPVTASAQPTELEEPHAEDRSVPLAEVATVTPIEALPRAPGLAALRGRFRYPDGHPAANVQLELRGWAASDERVQEHGEPQHWTDPRVKTAVDGTFNIELDPPLAYQFFLEARLEGYAHMCWVWTRLPPDEITDVGEMTLERAGSIRGRVLDMQAKPLNLIGMVRARSDRPVGADRCETSSLQMLDGSNSEFRLSGLPPGRASLYAYSDTLSRWIDGPRVEVRSGEEVHADILYDVRTERRITLFTYNRRVPLFSNPAPDTLLLIGEDDPKLVAVNDDPSRSSWHVDDVAPGTYTARLEDPNFRPWIKKAVRPGQHLQVELVGSASINLRVVEGETGIIVEPYTLQLSYRLALGKQYLNEKVLMRCAKDPAPVDGLYEGIVPGELSVLVDAPGRWQCEIDLPSLAPNETRTLRAELWKQ